MRTKDWHEIGRPRRSSPMTLTQIDAGAMSAPGRANAELGEAIARAGKAIGGALDSLGSQGEANAKFETEIKFQGFLQQQDDAYRAAERNISEDGTGLREPFSQGYFENAKKFLGDVPDKLKPDYDLKLRRHHLDFETKAREAEYRQQDTYTVKRVGEGLDAIYADTEANFSDPERLKTNLDRGRGLIDASPLPEKRKGELRTEFSSRAEERYFEAWRGSIEARIGKDAPEEIEKAWEDLDAAIRERAAPAGGFGQPSDPQQQPNGETAPATPNAGPRSDAGPENPDQPQTSVAASEYLRGRLAKGYEQRTGDVDNLNPVMQDRLAAFLQAAENDGIPINVISGHRSNERQAVLWANALKKYGSASEARKHVAPPGSSSHNVGLAVDLQYGDRKPGLGGTKTEAVKWAHANAAKYGLHFRLGHEDWHIEPVEVQRGGNAAGDVKLAQSNYFKGGAVPDRAGTAGVTGSAKPLDSSVDEVIASAAKTASVDPDLMRAFARIESGGKPDVRTGSYKGLFQLSDAEFRRYGGRGDIFDAEANAAAAARKLAAESKRFEAKYGRPPTASDLYLIHQQGEGGAAAHWDNPDQAAWKSMASTAEGRKKGAGWAKQAIWGNLTPAAKKQFGSVDKVTSGDFVKFWEDRVASMGGGPSQQNKMALGGPAQDTDKVSVTLTGTSEEKAAKLRDVVGQGYRDIVHQLDGDGNDVVIAKKSDTAIWQRGWRGKTEEGVVKNELDNADFAGPAWANDVVTELRASKFGGQFADASGAVQLPQPPIGPTRVLSARDQATEVAAINDRGRIQTLLDGVPDDMPLSKVPAALRDKVLGMFPPEAQKARTLPDGSKTSALDLMKVGEVKEALASQLRDTKRAADAAGIYTNKPRFNHISEATRQKLIRKIETDRRNFYLNQAEGEAKYILEHGEPKLDANGRTLIDRARNVLLPNQVEKLKFKLDAAKWQYDYIKPMHDMADDEINAKLEELTPQPGDDIQKTMMKGKVRDAAIAHADKIRKERDTDFALAVQRSAEVREAWAMIGAADKTFALGTGDDGSPVVQSSGKPKMTTQKQWETLIDARISAQERISGESFEGPEGTLSPIRILTRKEARNLLGLGNTKFGWNSLNEQEKITHLKNAAAQADKRYGKHARAAFNEAVRQIVNDNDSKDIAAGLLQKVIRGESISVAEAKRYEALRALTPLEAFTRKTPPADWNQPRLDGSRMTGGAAPENAGRPALMLSPQVAPEAHSSTISPTGKMGQAVQWFLKDPERRGPVLDSKLGPGTAKQIMEWMETERKKTSQGSSWWPF